MSSHLGTSFIESPGSANSIRLISTAVSFDSAGITSGAGFPIFTPTVGEVCLDFWLVVDTAWDGSTPQGDLGWASDASSGMMLRYFAAVWLLTFPDLSDFSSSPILNDYNNPSIDGSLTGVTLTASQRNAYCVSTGDLINRVVPFVFLTTEPVRMFVSSTSNPRVPSNPGSSQGAGRVMMLIASPEAA